MGEIVINNSINRLDHAGMLNIDTRRDNCRFVRASQKGYAKAGVKRPMWMEA